MRLFTIVIPFALLFLLFACGKKEVPPMPSGERIAMKHDGREVSFEPTHARFATFKKGVILRDSDIQNKNERVAAVVHRIYLANYDLQLTNAAEQDYRRIRSEGQYRVEITIEAAETATENAQLQAGEYVYKPDPFGRVSHVFLSYFKEGKDRSENLQTAEFGGKVRITSVTDSEIGGEIDVFDNTEYVKGSFTAQKLEDQKENQ
jgi:hypothetical protein